MKLNWVEITSQEPTIKVPIFLYKFALTNFHTKLFSWILLKVLRENEKNGNVVENSVLLIIKMDNILFSLSILCIPGHRSALHSILNYRHFIPYFFKLNIVGSHKKSWLFSDHLHQYQPLCETSLYRKAFNLHVICIYRNADYKTFYLRLFGIFHYCKQLSRVWH